MTNFGISEIYVDADGVLCAFDQYVLEKFGKRVEDFNPKGRFWQHLTHHDTHVEKFFLNLPKMHDADVLMAFLLGTGLPIRVLTACGNTPKDAKEQKIEWFAKHYPNVECIVVSKSPDKAAYATPTTVLIDDRSKSIDPWMAAGGIGILHRSADETIETLGRLLETVGLVE